MTGQSFKQSATKIFNLVSVIINFLFLLDHQFVTRYTHNTTCPNLSHITRFDQSTHWSTSTMTLGSSHIELMRMLALNTSCVEVDEVKTHEYDSRDAEGYEQNQKTVESCKSWMGP